MNDKFDDENDTPLAELAGHELDADRDLQGRVRRSINRNLLAGDVLELSFSCLMITFWDYVRLVVESLTDRIPPDKES